MNLETWFPTPIWNMVANIPDCQNQEAVNFCFALKQNSNGRVVSNVGGWQSNELFKADWLNTPLNFLVNAATANCQKALVELGSRKEAVVLNAWVNINGKTNHNQLHNHLNCDLSCVFYLTDNNSEIEFQRPYDIQKYFLDNLESNNSTAASFSHVTYSPSKNTFLIFPAWLQHSVKPNQNESPRISIAMNIKAV